MITAPGFVALFAVVAILCRAFGDYIGAASATLIAAGCVVAWVVVAVSPWWPLWLCVLWTTIAAALVTQRNQGVRGAVIAVLVELSALSYLLNYLSEIPSEAITAGANALGIAAAALLGGPHVGSALARGLDRASRLGMAPAFGRAVRGRVRGDHGNPARVATDQGPPP